MRPEDFVFWLLGYLEAGAKDVEPIKKLLVNVVISRPPNTLTQAQQEREAILAALERGE